MLDCCQSSKRQSKSLAFVDNHPRYKYSFKEQANILVNGPDLRETGWASTQGVQLGAGSNDQLQLFNSLKALQLQQQELNYFIDNRLKPLENEVAYYEREVKVRTQEIRELGELVNRVAGQGRRDNNRLPQLNGSYYIPRV